MAWGKKYEPWVERLQNALNEKLKEVKMAHNDEGVVVGKIEQLTNTHIKTTEMGIEEIVNFNSDDLTRKNITSDGKSADYYKLPKDAKEIQDLISFKNMNAQIGEMFRGLYRYGQCSHSDEIREIKKVIFYGQAELERLEKYGKK